MIGQAVQIATEVHKDQRYGGIPYLSHVAAVVVTVHRAIIDGGLWDLYDRAVSLAWLHDAVEDSGDRRAAVGQAIKAIDLRLYYTAMELTAPPGCTRSERRARLAAMLASQRRVLGDVSMPDSVREDAEAILIVKVADRRENLRACVRNKDRRLAMYVGEHEEFRDAAYVKGLCDGLWGEMDRLIVEVYGSDCGRARIE